MKTAEPGEGKSFKKKLIGAIPYIAVCLFAVSVVVFCSWGATVDTTVNQHTYLKHFGLDEKSRYMLVAYPGIQQIGSKYAPPTTEPTGATHWLQDAGGGKVRFAIAVNGKREVVEYPLAKIVWAKKPGAAAMALLSLTKGEDIKVNVLTARPWSKDPNDLYIQSDERANPDPEKVRKLLAWNERVDYYWSLRGEPDAVNTLLNRDGYRITITADPNTLDQIKREGGIS